MEMRYYKNIQEIAVDTLLPNENTRKMKRAVY